MRLRLCLRLRLWLLWRWLRRLHRLRRRRARAREVLLHHRVGREEAEQHVKKLCADFTGVYEGCVDA